MEKSHFFKNILLISMQSVVANLISYGVLVLLILSVNGYCKILVF